MVDDVLGIPPHTSHQRRTQRVEKEKPDEVETRAGLDDAPIMNRKAIVGRQREIDPVVIGSNPVHQMTFDTVRTVPSSRRGYPFLTPVVRGTRLMPAGAKSFRRTPEGDSTRGSRKWSRSFLPSAVFTVNRVATNHIMGVSR